jgi:FAD:protein FMN transferase
MLFSRRDFMAGGSALLAATALPAAGTDLLQIEGPAFGAGWRLRVAMGTDVGPLIRGITGVIDTIDAALSPFRQGSEISRFNRTETADWLPLSAPTCRIIAEAQRVAALTGGAFDPTLGGVAGRYGFGPITASPAGAFDDLVLSGDGVRKARPEQTLDLCGIAKGHALDLCTAALGALGCESFFLELGGEVMARGSRPDGEDWRLAIERPLPGQTTPHCVVDLRDEAIATSGDIIHSYAYAGRRYGHIIDPQLSAPSDTALASVSVFAPKAITADALATALFTMGPERGAAFAQSAGLDALFLSRDRPGLRQDMTGGFADRILRR